MTDVIRPSGAPDLVIGLPAEGADRRTRRSAETRERLFHAAMRIFAEKGFPSKEHILIAFSDMQMGKLQRFVEIARNGKEPMRAFFRAMSREMTSEPAKKPDVMRALLQANLSSVSVRNLMRERNARGERLLAEIMQIGQDRDELRRDVSALEMARVFRQLTFGTMLLWSVSGDDSLVERLDRAIDILWTGFIPREGVSSVT
jgi:AcrR family transcriptional regulator